MVLEILSCLHAFTAQIERGCQRFTSNSCTDKLFRHDIVQNTSITFSVQLLDIIENVDCTFNHRWNVCN